MVTERRAPAKVNLFLHVGPRAADGYHPVCTLLVFADEGDRLTLLPSAPAGLAVTGPFAEGLDAGEGNLVLQARDRLLSAVGGRPASFALALEKNLPVASGLGGGSADAAAALALVAQALAESGEAAPSEALLEQVAQSLGADVPACLASRSVMAEGRGDRFSPAPLIGPLPAVLVNSGAPCSTRAVYAGYDEGVAERQADRPDLPDRFGSPMDLARALGACRNDLEPPALAAQPAIAAVLTALRGQPECLIARMSGSGGTCFCLCASDTDARRVARRLAASNPAWWIRPCRLGGADDTPRARTRTRDL